MTPRRKPGIDTAADAELDDSATAVSDDVQSLSIDDVIPARRRNIPVIDLADYTIDPAAAALIPPNLGTRHGVIAIGFEDRKILLAMSDPGNVVAIDDVRAITGFEVKAVQASAADIAEAWRRTAPPDVTGAVAAVEEDIDDGPDVAVHVAEEAPMVRLVNMLIGQAVTARASDIHVEPNEREVRVRFRVDGVLHEHMMLSRALQAGIVSRIKIMSDMDIADRRIPQDGRTEMRVGDEEVDLRVATLPTLHGEKVVIRILAKATARLSLAELGLGEGSYNRYVDSFRRPQGMILVTGPTGSGKTTTLYATLNELNASERNIITVEDPVEYAVPGVYQIPVAQKAGLTFAAALRSILRSDPDVILVGEIRDRETARLAVEAALTGHLVLSSLHTNDSASSVSRLIEMGVEPFLVASALDCVLAQRLVRVLCERCKEPYEAPEETLRDARIPMTGEPVWLMRAVGCTRCGRTGYRGRTGVYETLVVTDEIERLAADHRPSEEIERLAERQGMRSLYSDALEKVLLGVTTLEEVLRVVGAPRAIGEEVAPVAVPVAHVVPAHVVPVPVVPAPVVAAPAPEPAPVAVERPAPVEAAQGAAEAPVATVETPVEQPAPAAAERDAPQTSVPAPATSSMRGSDGKIRLKIGKRREVES